MKKVIVIGAGVSGMMAAIQAAKKHHVVLLESNSSCGKKLLATGNGRCNYWNEAIDTSAYQTHHFSILEKILINKDEVFKELKHFGLYPKIRDGYYYPYSNTASSVKTLFEYQLTKSDISLKYTSEVVAIEKEENSFMVYLADGSFIKGDAVILATGSKAAPKTGSKGIGYQILKQFAHTIYPVNPSLTPLFCKEAHPQWAGIRTQAKLNLFIDDVYIQSSEGELHLTEKGISGICVFNLSGYVSSALKNCSKVEIFINFLPFLESNFDDFMESRIKSMPDAPIGILLESLFHYKVLQVLLKKSKIQADDFYQTLTSKRRENLKQVLTNYKVEIIDTGDFERAQVCIGGLSLEEINPLTMESINIKNLYIAGELLDVSGICGGYNIAFALITGYLAGKSI